MSNLFRSINNASTNFLNEYNGVNDEATPEKHVEATPEKHVEAAPEKHVEAAPKPSGKAAFKVLTTPELLTHINSFKKISNINLRIEGLTGDLTQTTYKVFSDALKTQIKSTSYNRYLSNPPYQTNPGLVLQILENYYTANSNRLTTQPKIIGESCNYEDVINDMVNWSSSNSDITKSLGNNIKNVYAQIIDGVKMSENHDDNGLSPLNYKIPGMNLPKHVLPGHLLNIIYTFLKGQVSERFRSEYAYIILHTSVTEYHSSLDDFAQAKNNGRANIKYFTDIVYELLPSLYDTFRYVFFIEPEEFHLYGAPNLGGRKWKEGKRINKRQTKRVKSNGGKSKVTKAKTNLLKKRTRKI